MVLQAAGDGTPSSNLSLLQGHLVQDSVVGLGVVCDSDQENQREEKCSECEQDHNRLSEVRAKHMSKYYLEN